MVSTGWPFRSTVWMRDTRPRGVIGNAMAHGSLAGARSHECAIGIQLIDLFIGARSVSLENKKHRLLIGQHQIGLAGKGVLKIPGLLPQFVIGGFRAQGPVGIVVVFEYAGLLFEPDALGEVLVVRRFGHDAHPGKPDLFDPDRSAFSIPAELIVDVGHIGLPGGERPDPPGDDLNSGQNSGTFRC